MDRFYAADSSLTIAIAGAVVSDRGELVRRSVKRQPLLHRELLLWAAGVGTRSGDLDVVAVPSVSSTRTVGRKINGAHGSAEALSTAAEDVQISPLVVVVSRLHKAAPGFQIGDVHLLAVDVVDLEADGGICASLDDGTSPDIHSVHAIVWKLRFGEERQKEEDG